MLDLVLFYPSVLFLNKNKQQAHFRDPSIPAYQQGHRFQDPRAWTVQLQRIHLSNPGSTEASSWIQEGVTSNCMADSRAHFAQHLQHLQPPSHIAPYAARLAIKNAASHIKRNKVQSCTRLVAHRASIGFRGSGTMPAVAQDPPLGRDGSSETDSRCNYRRVRIQPERSAHRMLT